MGFVIDTEILKKIVNEAVARNHNEISFVGNEQVLSRKTKDGYWEEIDLENF